jgi:hypoxanthine phosphoribosyltransferase
VISQTVNGLTLGEVLISAESIAARIAELATEIEETYADSDSPLILVGVLKGSVFFTADLGRALKIPVEFDFIAVRSYGEGTHSSGTVELVKDISRQISERDVLLVEDIIDTGLTTSFLFSHLAQHRPRSLRLVSLLDKKGRRQREVTIDFRGFDIPNKFVVGYGLDVAERWRNLPEIRMVNGA